MKATLRGAPDRSDRTKRALQDYCALNTIITAIERMRSGLGTETDAAIVLAFVQADGQTVAPRLRFDCPLGRRAAALGMLGHRRISAGRTVRDLGATDSPNGPEVGAR